MHADQCPYTMCFEDADRSPSLCIAPSLSCMTAPLPPTSAPRYMNGRSAPHICSAPCMESYDVNMVAAIPHARPTGAYFEHDALLHIHTLSAMGVSTLPVKLLDQHSALRSVASALGPPISGRGAAASG